MFAAIVWFLLWVSFSRTGQRYDLFIGVPLVCGTAWLLLEFLAPLGQKLVQKIPVAFVQARHRWITAGIVTLLLLPILFWTPLGGHANYAVAATKLRTVIPGEGPLKNAFQWLKENTQDAVVGIIWDYGIQLNVFSGAKNIIDTDHYLQHWVHLYCRHVFSAQSETEALSFLKTHHATHLLLMSWEVTNRSADLSFIGSDAENDRQFRFYDFEKTDSPTEGTERMTLPEPPLAFIDITAPTPQARKVTVQFRNNTTVDRELVLQDSEQPYPVDLENGGVLLFFDAENRLQNAQYLPLVGWNSLAIKLFFRRSHTKVFIPVFPTDNDDKADVKIWEIQYPDNIKKDNKYLATGLDGSDEK